MSSRKTESIPPQILERARTIVDRTIQRNIKGLDFLTTPPVPVGLTPKEVLYERGTLRLYHYLPQADRAQSHLQPKP